jgi:uncharacterized RDD family membrane protein YckC
MTSAEKTPGAPYPWRTAGRTVPAAPSGGGSAQGRRAGVVTRCLANAADVGVVLLLLVGGYAAVAVARFLLHPVAFQFPAPGARTLLLIGGCLQAVYFAVTWAAVGRTYGDRLLGLRVVSGRGARPGWPRAAVRAAFCVLFPLGLFWVLVSRQNRSLQDVLLRTSVIYDRSAT